LSHGGSPHPSPEALPAVVPVAPEPVSISAVVLAHQTIEFTFVPRKFPAVVFGFAAASVPKILGKPLSIPSYLTPEALDRIVALVPFVCVRVFVSIPPAVFVVPVVSEVAIACRRERRTCPERQTRKHQR
jgi:hypothetical protein